MKDAEHPFFRPLWLRIAIVVACSGWAAFEFSMGNMSWGWITTAVAAYGAWTFLIAYKPPQDSSSRDTTSQDKDPTEPE
ncbi:DUF3329 domain-containing protein [Roseibium aestuarii]|uniref:DUF3329 domain-containing protein n=1 Tax=Roseibium aestuarii TaxID=2600299 RepID=A0ABW4K0B4_9HYPH|nr:DUF3329 domain-containing protein [Roseibium aestuarii]